MDTTGRHYPISSPIAEFDGFTIRVSNMSVEKLDEPNKGWKHIFYLIDVKYKDAKSHYSCRYSFDGEYESGHKLPQKQEKRLKEWCKQNEWKILASCLIFEHEQKILTI